MREASAEKTAAAQEVRDGVCGICPAGCWIRAHLRGGRLVRVEPMPDHPLGMICTIGEHAPDIVYDKNRLRTPLRRKGKKGSHDFTPIGWDEAFDEIVARLQATKTEHGAEATAIYTGRGSFDMAMCDLMQPADAAVSSASSVLFPFGSPNTLGVGALCYVAFAMIAPHVTMGEMYITMETDLEHAEVIVIWGSNPATDSPPTTHQQVLDAKRRGAEVIVIDPRRNGTARESDAKWIPIRPGTDGALALGLLNVLIEHELYDDGFVDAWTVGFEDLSRMVQHYTPDVVERITGVEASTVIWLARRIASARGACPVMYTGLEYSDSGVQAIRAVFTLWALAGQLDVPGGLLFRMKENQFPQNRRHLIENPDVRRALGRNRFPIYSDYRGESHAVVLPDAVLRSTPYPIRSLLILGGSLITSWPQPEIWKETLGALDFLVCVDRHLTADAAYADIVLPATTMFEITSYMRYGPVFKIREKLIDPVGEARSDFLILAELARRLGYGEAYPQAEEDILRWALEGTEFSLEDVRDAGGSVTWPTVMMQYKKWEKGKLRPDGEPGFATPTGKFEIASTTLAEHGYDPLPVYTEPAEGPLARPDLAARFPLVFNSGSRTRFDFRSQHHGVLNLQRHNPEPTVWINTDDATARGIRDGDLVWVETPRAKLSFRAVVTDHIVRGAVDAAMGGGGPAGPRTWRETNVNELTDLGRMDPISGFPIYKALLCEVSLAESGTSERTPRIQQAPSHHAPLRSSRPLRHVYLDHNATTPVATEVVDAMLPLLREQWGNPSSIHAMGSAARDHVESARRIVAEMLNCTARRIVFTSGGSEANNLAIMGLARRGKPGHIVTSAVEHPAVLAACRALEREGHRLTVLPVDRAGLVAPARLKAALCRDTRLVSIMAANNEVGTVQPIRALADIAHDHGVPLHCDAVQALGKIHVDVEAWGVDLLSVSSHKVHGPKGVGALFVRKGMALAPLIEGGGQEHGLRSGTENVPGIVGFGRACELARRRLLRGDLRKVAALRDALEQGVLERVEGSFRNGPERARLPNTCNVTLPGIRGESLVLHLDRKGICFSSGSACKSGNPAPSHALMAMGLSEELAHCAVRFSLGPDNTREDIEHVLEALDDTLQEAHALVRFIGCR
jgi:cysteine desulfurase NifS